MVREGGREKRSSYTESFTGERPSLSITPDYSRLYPPQMPGAQMKGHGVSSANYRALAVKANQSAAHLRIRRDAA